MLTAGKTSGRDTGPPSTLRRRRRLRSEVGSGDAGLNNSEQKARPGEQQPPHWLGEAAGLLVIPSEDKRTGCSHKHADGASVITHGRGRGGRDRGQLMEPGFSPSLDHYRRLTPSFSSSRCRWGPFWARVARPRARFPPYSALCPPRRAAGPAHR